MSNSIRPRLFDLVEGSLGSYDDQVDQSRAAAPSGFVQAPRKKEVQFSNQPFERTFKLDAFEQAGAIARLAGCFSRDRRKNEDLLRVMAFDQDRHGTWLHADGSFLVFEKNGGSVANAGRIRDYDPGQRQFPRSQR